MIYDGLHVVDCTTGIAGAYCAKLLTDLGADVVFGAPIGHNPLFTYLRSSQRNASDLAPWLAHADVVIVGEPGTAPAGSDPLVTISITPLGHGGPDDGLDLTEEVLQARSGSLAGHGYMHMPPLTVGGKLAEYIVGAFAALGGLTAWTARFAHARRRDCRRVDARSDADDLRRDAHALCHLSRRASELVPVGDDPGQRADR